MKRTFRILAILGLVCSALALVRMAEALSCPAYTQEAVTLKLESVTVDGEPVEDTSAYEAFELHLEGSPYDGNQVWDFSLFASQGNRTWLEQYR